MLDNAPTNRDKQDPNPDYLPGYTQQENIVASDDTQRVLQSDELLATHEANKDSTILGNLYDAATTGGNIAYDLYSSFEIQQRAGDPDPTWEKTRKDTWIDTHKDIPLEQRWHYYATSNETHANMMYADAMEKQDRALALSKRSGIGPALSGFGVGIIDADLPLAVVGGGFMKAAGAGLRATKSGSMMAKTGRVFRGSAGGAAVMTTTAAIDYLANPNSDWTSVGVMALMGAGFGAIAPGPRAHPDDAALPHKFNQAVSATLDTLDENIQAGFPTQAPTTRPLGTDDFGFVAGRQTEQDRAAAHAATPIDPVNPRAPAVFSTETLDTYSEFKLHLGANGPVSMGAAVNPLAQRAGALGAEVLSKEQKALIEGGRRSLRDTGLEDYIDEAPHELVARLKSYGAVGKAANAFNELINATPLANDFMKFWRSPSTAARALVVKMLDNDMGIVRGVESAATMRSQYHRGLMQVTIPYDKTFEAWREQRYPTKGYIDKARRFHKQPQHMDEYNRELITEIMHRKYDAQTTDKAPHPLDPAIKAHGDFYGLNVDQLKGLPGEISVVGADDLVKDPLYIPQRITPSTISTVVRKLKESGVKEPFKHIKSALSKVYMQMHPGMKEKDATIWSAATIDRAQQNALGSSTSLIGLLKDNNRFMVEQLLVRNGVPEKEAHTLIDRLMSIHEEGRKPGFMKERISVDFRLSMDGVSMMDLFDTDLTGQYHLRARQSAGSAALARIGLPSKLHAELYKKTIIDEQAALGKPVDDVGVRGYIDGLRNNDVALSKQDLDGIFGYFTDDNLSGDISPWYGRVRKITHLALMGKDGLTNLADASSIMSAIGVEQFLRRFPKAFKDALKDKASPTVDELRPYGVSLPLDRIERADRQFELETTRLTPSGSFMQTADRYLNAGVNIQGYLTGSNAIRNTLRNMAVDGAVSRLFEGLNGKVVSTRGPLSPERLLDMGFDPEFQKVLRGYMNTVTFNAEGWYEKLSLKDWTPEHRQKFLRIIDRATDKAVHQARLGESNYLFHKDGFAGLMMQLKSFPMTTFRKQFYRNVYIGDTETGMMFSLGLVTASVAYMAKQAIDGRTENLSAEHIARGALGYSNMTGWFPFWVDPITAMLGLDSLNLSGYHRPGQGNLAVPASFRVLQNLSEIPGIPLDILTGNFGNSSVNAMKALPMGNTYGMARIWGALRDEHVKEEAPASTVPPGEEALPKIVKDMSKEYPIVLYNTLDLNPK